MKATRLSILPIIYDALGRQVRELVNAKQAPGDYEVSWDGTLANGATLEAENAFTEQRTAHLAGLHQAIFDEIKARTRETDLSVPTRSRGYWYYGRSFEGREYGASCRVPVADPADWSPPTIACYHSPPV